MISRNSLTNAYPKKQLGDIVEFLDNMRRPVTESDRRAGKYPYYGANGCQGTIDDFLFDEPLVLLAEDGGHFDNPDRGIAYRVSGKAWVNNHAHVLRPRECVDLRFLCRVLENYDVTPWVTGTTRGKLTQAGASQIMVPLPPLPEQRRIAEILDKADALRAKRRAALAQLDTLTQSIFLEMFGDPATNPKGWPTRRLDTACSLVNGRAFKPEEWEEEGLPIIRIQNLNDTSKPFNYTTQSLPNRFRVRPGDILFSWSGTPGTSFGCFRWRGPEGWLNQHIFNVRLSGALEGDYFIAHVNLKLVELIAKAHGGVGLQHVTKGMVDETMLMTPPAHLQIEFCRRVAGVEALATDQRASLRDLDSLFASLQYRAFREDLWPAFDEVPGDAHGFG